MSRFRKTVLCIDDSWNGLIARKLFLEQNGYKVLEATSGDEGFQLFLSREIDAVVVDYLMPGMNGDVVATKMKQRRPHVPILLLSAYGPLPENKLQAVDAFLLKSCESQALLPTLRQLLTCKPKPFFTRWLDTWRGRQAAKL